MYINLKKAKKHLKRGDLELLYALKQKDLEYLEEELTKEDLGRFEELDYIQKVKVPKKDLDSYKSLRLSDKAKSLLKDLEEAPIDEEDEKIFDWLKKHYLSLGKDIGNGAKTKRHIRDFRLKSDIEKNNLIKLVLDFLAENEERSNKLEYIFYYPKTAFDTKFNLDGSWLWNHFEKNRARIEETFEKY